MGDSKQEGPSAREPACVLCRRVEADPDTCGDKLQKGGLCAHVFCMFFATLLFPQENDRVGLMGFLPRDILIAVQRAAQKVCCICGQMGATIMCCTEDCGRWFHLPCAKEGGCINQYITPFSSFCPEHRLEQDVQATPEPDTDCLICMEPVEDRMTFTTLVCPTCTRAWFHRDCIQGLALRAGLLCLHCPLCRDSEAFIVEMIVLGIRIPFRQPTWEDNNAFADLGERHSQCNAAECLYPGGREEAEEEGPWELLLCSSCAAEGTHRRCSGLSNSTRRWECDTCAGLGTAARDESELIGPSLTRQSGWDSAHGSSESEAISPSSTVPLEPASPSPSPETRSHSRPQHAAWQQSLPSFLLDTSSIRRSRSTYSSSPDPEDRVHSRHARPGHRRSRSRQQGQARNRPVPLRSRRNRSSRTRSRPGRPQRRETPSRASAGHNRSRQQGWAQSPPVRSRSRRDRINGTEPRAERPRRRETSSGKSPRHSHSRLQPRASNQSERSRSRQDRSRRTTASAERPRRRETSSGTFPRRSSSRLQGWAQSPPVRSRSRHDRNSGTEPRAERPRRRETSSRTSSRRSLSRQQGRAQSPPVRSKSCRDRNRNAEPRAERPRQRETSSGTSPECSRSRLQRRASNQPARSRSRQDRSRRTAASAERPRHRETSPGTSRRSSRSRQRRRTSTGTSNSST